MKGAVRLILGLLTLLVGGPGTLPSATAMGTPTLRPASLLAGTRSDVGSTQRLFVIYDGTAHAYDAAPLAARRSSEPASLPRSVAELANQPAWGPARVSPVGVAANAGRVFTSADAHVADAANAIEAALPGRVVGVNGTRTMSNGLSREVDIDLGNLLVQVKSGNARGLTGQIGKTQSSTGVRTIGYAPDITDAAWKNAPARASQS